MFEFLMDSYPAWALEVTYERVSRLVHSLFDSQVVIIHSISDLWLECSIEELEIDVSVNGGLVEARYVVGVDHELSVNPKISALE